MENFYEDNMEYSFLVKIDEIIEIIEEKDFGSYYYDGKNFIFIDKNRNINFSVKKQNDSYHIKDKISGNQYYFSKKFLDEETTIQQIIIVSNNSKRYYSFLERDSMISLIEFIKVEENERVICRNNYVYGKEIEDILKFADEVFEDDLNEIEKDENSDSDDSLDENTEIEQDDKFYPGTFSNNELTYEDLQLALQYSFEQSENEEIIDDNIPEKEYLEALICYYENYTLQMNTETVDGERKTKLIPDIQVELEDVYISSICVYAGIEELITVLNERNERAEPEK